MPDQSVMGLLPLLLLLVLMIWMITSQRRRQREVASMQSSLGLGDEVLTVGGVIGRITRDEGPILHLEIAPGVVIRVDRRTVSGRTSDVPAFRAAEGAAPGRIDAPDAERVERRPEDVPPRPDDEPRA